MKYVSSCNVYKPAGLHIPFVEINIGFLANQVGIPTTNTLDLSQGVHDFAFAINVSVQKTENMLYEVAKQLMLLVRERRHSQRTWNCWWASGRTRDILIDRRWVA
jgi:hypothetical protein